MRSVFAVAALAAVAAAAPLYITVDEVDVVTAVVTVTAGEGSEPAETPAVAQHFGHGPGAGGPPGGWPGSGGPPVVVTTTMAPVVVVTSSPAPVVVVPVTTTPPPPPPTTSVYVAPTVAPSTHSSAAPTTHEQVKSVQAAATTSASPTAASTPTSGSAILSPYGYTGPMPTDYSAKVVLHHNIHRNNHSAPALHWDDNLAATAQTIAETCVYAHSMNVNGGGYGQNIAAGVDKDNVGDVISDMFYNGEVVNFPMSQYGQPNVPDSIFESVGHFTQVVWKATTAVGCYTANCPNGLANTGGGVSPWFTVCNYAGAGNYGGEYGDNVGKPLGLDTVLGNFQVVS